MHAFSRLAELFEDWKYLFRQDGAMSALSAVALDVARLPYKQLRLLILMRSLAKPLPDIKSKIHLEIFRFETPHLELVRAIDRPSHANLCERHLAHEHHGLIALYKGLAAGYAWGYRPVDTELERVHLQLEPGIILCDDAYTAPALRGRGVQTALTLARFQIFRDLGYSQSVCYIDVQNRPSLAVWQRKFDAQTAGEINFLRVGAWYRVRCNWSPISMEQRSLGTSIEDSRPDLII